MIARIRTANVGQTTGTVEQVEWVGLNDAGDVVCYADGTVATVIASEWKWVELECARCGQYGRDILSSGEGRWTCLGNDDDASCEETRRLIREAGR